MTLMLILKGKWFHLHQAVDVLKESYLIVVFVGKPIDYELNTKLPIVPHLPGEGC